MADHDESPNEESASEPSLIVWLAILGGLSLVAAGAGGILGFALAPTKFAQTSAEMAEPTPERPQQNYSSGEQVSMLPPIVTNLISPRGTYVRLEAAVVFRGVPEGGSELMLSRVSSDIMAVLRSMKLAQIEGPSGLQHLREDLSARAAVRSDGLIREVVLHSLVVE